jgi:hypothetical protein
VAFGAQPARIAAADPIPIILSISRRLVVLFTTNLLFIISSDYFLHVS